MLKSVRCQFVNISIERHIMAFLGIRPSEMRKILTAYHLGNIVFSLSFFVIKTTPWLCTFFLEVEKELCVLDRREHEILVFLGVIIVWKNRKALNWLHYLSNVFFYSKLANIYLFLRADLLIGTVYCVILLIHAVVFPEPVHVGPEVITYFQGAELHNEIEKNKRITWMVQFYTTWSAECKHVSPVFSKLSERFHLPNLRFAKLDVGRYPKEAERFRINIHPASRQLPTISLFQDGKETLRRPAIRDKRALPFLFSEENIILEYGLNNLYQYCKSNMKKHEKRLVDEKSKVEVINKKIN